MSRRTWLACWEASSVMIRKGGNAACAYRRVRGLNDIEAQLARALDRTGTILALVNWLRWLYHEGRPYDDLSAIVRRLESLLNRIESWGI